MRSLIQSVLRDPITIALTCVCVTLGAIFAVLVFAGFVMKLVGVE